VEKLTIVTDMEILISECLIIAGFGQSPIRKMATPVLPTDLTQVMQMLMQEREDRKLEREAAERKEERRLENAKLEREAAEKKEERRLESEAKEREAASENAKLEREAERRERRAER